MDIRWAGLLSAPAPPGAVIAEGLGGLLLVLLAGGAAVGVAGLVIADRLRGKDTTDVPSGRSLPVESLRWTVWLAVSAVLGFLLLLIALPDRPGATAAAAAAPLAHLVTRAASVVAAGFLVMAALMPVAMWQSGGTPRRLWDFGSAGAGVWLAAATLQLGLDYSAQEADASAASFGAFAFGAAGSPLLAQLVLVAVVAVAAGRVRRWSAAVGTAPLAVYAVLPAAYAGGAATRSLAGQVSLAMHLIGTSVWVGGLLALAVIARHAHRRAASPEVRRQLDAELNQTVPIFSRVALACAVLVGSTGVLMALNAVGSVNALLSSSGLILIAKAALTAVALLVYARKQRAVAIPALAGVKPDGTLGDPDGSAFAALAVREVVLLVSIIVLAVAALPAGLTGS